MKVLKIRTRSAESLILIGAGLPELSRHLNAESKLMVVDQRVRELHAQSLPAWDSLAIKGGEQVKSLSQVEKLYDGFLAANLDRSAWVVAVGGGTISDAAGFAAATYLRGLRLAVVATTLLAQVDAAVGGKNGVNFGGYKNLVGTIRQPELVLCDPLFLKTLSALELKQGLAEVIKAAAIESEELFSLLQTQREAILRLDAPVLEELIYRTLSIKAAIVEADELESGERVKLNFGHTLAHALESVFKLSHGESVAIGMLADARLSEKRGLIGSDARLRLERTIESFGLPVRLPGKSEALAEALFKDKKRRDNQIKMALLTAIGKSRLELIDLAEVKEVINDLP
jgi:3-dehydroquinate synthase